MLNKCFELSLEEIERQFGKSNFDDCGDHFIAIFNQINEGLRFDKKLQWQWRFEHQHSNPYYHKLILELQASEPAQLERIASEIASLKLSSR